MAFLHQTKPLSTFKILGEALKLSTQNPTLILTVLGFSFISDPSIFLFILLPVTSLTTDITTKSMAIASLDPSTITPEDIASLQASILKDVKEIIGIEVVALITSFILFSLIYIAIIHVFSLAYTGESLTPRELICRVVKKLKGPMITRLYVVLLSLGYSLLLLTVLFGFIALLYTLISPTVSIVIGVVLAISGLVVYMFLSLVWSVSVVVSVVEDCYGLAAISKAGEAIKGRRWQGVRLVLIMSAFGGVIFGIYSFGFKGANLTDPPSSFTLAKLGFGLVFTLASALLGLFEWAIVMVFYCDCKESKGEFEWIKATDGGFVYASLPMVDDQNV